MDDLLKRYLRALEQGRFPEYLTIKALLRILNSVEWRDGINRAMQDCFQGRYKLLDAVFQSHQNLSLDKVRDPIEDERRLDIRNNKDWYASETRDDQVSDGERRTTELISAVEIVYYLIYKSRVNPEEFENFFEMDPLVVFDLSKLISAFTGDFKMLEIYLDNCDSQDQLLEKMINYFPTLITEPYGITEMEISSYKSILLQHLDPDIAAGKLDCVIGFFDDHQSSLGGIFFRTLFSSIAVVGLMCENVDKLYDFDLKLARLYSRTRRENAPFILTTIRKIVKEASESLGDVNIRSSPNFLVMQSHHILAVFMPVLRFSIETGFRSFDRESLRVLRDNILSDDNQKFLNDFKKEYFKQHAELIRCLEAI